jgi:hypothetical protein
VDGGGCVGFVDGADPFADRCWGDVTELCGAEVGLDEVGDVGVVSGCSGGAEADACVVPLVEPFTEACFACLGVGVVAGVEVGLGGA